MKINGMAKVPFMMLRATFRSVGKMLMSQFEF